MKDIKEKENKKTCKEEYELLKKLHKEFLHEEEEKRKEKKIAPQNAYISLRNINKIYDNHIQAVFDFNLDIQKHELVSLVGPSGCGKSTTLRMIAGLEEITTGDLFIDGVYSNEKTAKERDISMVFQNYALYPHMTVYENMAFGLRTRHFKDNEIDERVKKAANILQISQYLNRRPKELSGGQRQRVALGRAIVRDAKVFLMDEPLSNLDAKLRVSMRSEIIKLHKQINATTIYVTHDQTEAMTMSDRIVVMKDGYIQQIGKPEEIYNHPINTFVATFIGAPAMNLIKCVYSNGVLTMDDKFSIKLSKEQIEKHNSFYANCITHIEEQIKNKEYEKIDKNLIMTFNEKKKTIKELLSHKKYVRKIKTSEERLKELNSQLDYYKKCLSSSHELIFGIRPEDIYEVNNVMPYIDKSEELDLPIVIAELLGSEYHVHLDFQKQDLIAKFKALRILSTNMIIKIIFDKNKIHLFDSKNLRAII